MERLDSLSCFAVSGFVYVKNKIHKQKIIRIPKGLAVTFYQL
ncbi:hypothetical protein DF16_pBMB400orf00145 (plasmid) [Bacillus thuringiensis serovar kurstaki str. YBT-1520]|nr:hypothetical protein DF16_pBMB400orf00145 [Bacillus thuringiensis serovar kurstaki str. YBT-1520]